MLKLTAGNKAKTWNRKWIETKTDVNVEVIEYVKECQTI